MSYKRNNIDLKEAANIIFELIPDKELKKYEKEINKKSFILHWKENSFRRTNFSSKKDLKKRILCILLE